MSEEMPIGTVLCSRNIKDSDNRKSAIINHNCIYIGEGNIVEAQQGKGVIITTLETYKARAYNYFVLYPRDKNLGIKAAEVAKTLVGKQYGMFSSYRPRLYTGKLKKLSCVSVVDYSYSKALETKLHLRNPDTTFKQTDIFTTDLNQVK